MIYFSRGNVIISMKRVKKLPDNPNGLFLQWLEEFLAEAETQGHSGLMKIYRMCIESLKKYRNIKTVRDN